MTMARIHPFCKVDNFDIGYFNGKEVYPRSITERIKTLYLCNNRFCLI